MHPENIAKLAQEQQQNMSKKDKKGQKNKKQKLIMRFKTKLKKKYITKKDEYSNCLFRMQSGQVSNLAHKYEMTHQSHPPCND